VLRTPRARDVVELAALVAGYLGFTWLLLPAFRSPAALVAIVAVATAGGAWVAYVSPILVHGDSPETRGLGTRRTLWARVDNLGPAAVRFGLLAAGVTALLLALGLLTSPERLAAFAPERFLRELGRYVPLALAQGIALVFFLVRLDHLSGEGSGASRAALSTGTAALLFALIHAPNAAMVALSGLFALAAAAAFRSRPNLFALVLCHAWSGAVLRSVTDIPTRVGPFVSQPDVRPARAVAAAFLDFLVSLFAAG
jgi:hypothetical protein